MKSLNPYCSGRWSRTAECVSRQRSREGLNPYYSGRWSRTDFLDRAMLLLTAVLILIIVEDGLVQQLEDQLKELNKSLNPYCNGRWSRTGSSTLIQVFQLCLNPYCSGRWSRTFINFFIFFVMYKS